MLAATGDLVGADIALRRSCAHAAREALGGALQAAQRAGIPALVAEVEHALRALDMPAARRIAAGETRLLRLEQVEDVLGSGNLVVDGCRRTVRDTRHVVALARRPVLFGIARALAEAWPSDVPRDELIARVFEARRPNESHRIRLRVEVGRLRKRAAPARRRARHDARLRARPAGCAQRRRPCPAGRRRGHDAARAARGWCSVVHVGARARPRREPAHGAARAIPAGGGGPCPLARARAGTALARATDRRIHDNRCYSRPRSRRGRAETRGDDHDASTRDHCGDRPRVRPVRGRAAGARA